MKLSGEGASLWGAIVAERAVAILIETMEGSYDSKAGPVTKRNAIRVRIASSECCGYVKDDSQVPTVAGNGS